MEDTVKRLKGQVKENTIQIHKIQDTQYRLHRVLTFKKKQNKNKTNKQTKKTKQQKK